MDQISTIILGVSLMVIMLGMGLSLVVEDFKRIFFQPKAILIGLCNQILILPLIAFGLAVLFSVKPEIAVGLMILAACPGGPTSNLISHLAKADTALSVTLTAFSSFITILTIPFIINFSLEYFLDQSTFIQLNKTETFLQILIIVIIPIAVGMLIRNYKDEFALKMAKPVRIASAILLVLVIIGILIKEKETIFPSLKETGFIILILNLVVMVFAYFSAKTFKIANRRALSIAIESGIQNGTLGITVAVVLLKNSAFAIVPAVYSLIMFFTGALVVFIGLIQNKKSTS